MGWIKTKNHLTLLSLLSTHPRFEPETTVPCGWQGRAKTFGYAQTILLLPYPAASSGYIFRFILCHYKNAPIQFRSKPL